MILEVTKCDDFLGIILNVFNPATGQAQVPVGPVATIYQMDPTVAGGFVVTSLAVILTQINAIVGLWGGVIDITGYNVRDLVVVVTTIVGGVDRTEIKILGPNLGAQRISVGGPSITAIPGINVQEAKV
jgi:hypothetical protein